MEPHRQRAGRSASPEDKPEENPVAEESLQSGAPTMADVAAHVGVSRSLVSLVFRNRPGPNPQTRARILKAADELGYQPDTAAQMLRRRRRDQFGVLFDFEHEFERELVMTMYEEAGRRGYSLVLSGLGRSRSEQAAVEELLGARTAALIIVGATVSPQALRQLSRHVPVVEVGRHTPAAGTDVVQSRGDVGTAMLVEHLLSLGHREIIHLDGDHLPAAEARRAGYLRAMQAAGLGHLTRTVHGEYTEESGARAAIQLLAEPSLPTAIVAGNDQSAAGLIMMLSRAGVRVPEDVSVTGFDDATLAGLSHVQLTTVRQDAQEMGVLAVKAALERIAGRHEPGEFVIEPQLVVRGSTAPPRSGTA